MTHRQTSISLAMLAVAGLGQATGCLANDTDGADGASAVDAIADSTAPTESPPGSDSGNDAPNETSAPDGMGQPPDAMGQPSDGMGQSCGAVLCKFPEICGEPCGGMPPECVPLPDSGVCPSGQTSKGYCWPNCLQLVCRPVECGDAA